MLVEVQGSGSPVVVDDLDDDFVLQLVGDSEVQAREAERRRLRLARHWAERHAVSEVLDAAHWTDADPRDVEETIGGGDAAGAPDRQPQPRPVPTTWRRRAGGTTAPGPTAAGPTSPTTTAPTPGPARTGSATPSTHAESSPSTDAVSH